MDSAQHWPVIGHEWAVDQLDRALRHGRMRHAYLFTGPAQIGKMTLARAFAAALNCTGDQPPCGHCRACTLIAKDAHPDVTIVESDGGTLKIDQIRALQQMLALRPYEARYRVAILRRFHEARPTAQDALLKTLEEPSPNTVLILTANAADGLLPTIISRCQPLHLRPLPVETVRAALEQGWDAPPETAQTLAQISGGRIGWAIRALHNPDELDQRSATLDLLETLLSGNRRARFALIDRLSLDKPALIDMLDVWQGYWRDTLLIASGSRAPVTNYDHLDAITQLAQQIGTDTAQQALEATRRTLSYLDKNTNTRLALEVLTLDYPVFGS
jgi:DNA polymerase-3 subunit delta'